jgi:hypothetical protein
VSLRLELPPESLDLPHRRPQIHGIVPIIRMDQLVLQPGELGVQHLHEPFQLTVIQFEAHFAPFVERSRSCSEPSAALSIAEPNGLHAAERKKSRSPRSRQDWQQALREI